MLVCKTDIQFFSRTHLQGSAAFLTSSDTLVGIGHLEVGWKDFAREKDRELDPVTSKRAPGLFNTQFYSSISNAHIQRGGLN
jgi:hypothetical protein